MGVYEDVLNKAGEPPKSPGFLTTPAAKRDYMLQRKIYEDVVSKASGELIDRALTPMSAQDFSQITGLDPTTAADPSGYKTRTIEEPSLVPKVAQHFTREGDRPMGVKLEPEVVQAQGPPNILQRNVEDTGTMRGIETRYPTTTMLKPVPVELQGPPNPAGPAFYERPGDPVRTQKTEFDPLTPASPVQRHLIQADIKREATWPKGMGQGSATWQTKYDTIKRAYGEDAANYWAAEGMLPKGLKALNLEARTEASDTRAGLMKSQTTGQDLKNEYAPTVESDRHRAADDKHDTSLWMRDFKERQMAFDQAYKNAAQRAIRERDGLALERLNETRHWHDRLGALAGAIDKSGQGDDASREEFKKMFDTLSGMGEREATPEEMSLFEKWFGAGPRYQFRPRPPLGSTQSQGTPAQAPSAQPQATQSSPQSSPDVSSEIDNLLKSKGIDIDKARKEGVTYQKKTYKYSNGKWSE